MTDLFSLLSSAFLCIVRFNSNELSIYCLYFENKTYKIAKKTQDILFLGLFFPSVKKFCQMQYWPQAISFPDLILWEFLLRKYCFDVVKHSNECKQLSFKMKIEVKK